MVEDTLADAPRTYGAPRTLGVRLKAAREAKGFSLAEVSNRTRIPQRQLVALEADAHETLPGLIFAIGFAKSFAREVGVDPEEAAQQFRAETTRSAYTPPNSTFEPIEPERVPSRRLAWISAGVVAAAVVGLIVWYQGRDPEAVETTAVTSPPEIAADQQPEQLAPQPAAPAGPPTALAAGANVPALAPTTNPGAPIAPAPVPVGGNAVTLTAREDVWIQISDRASGRKVNSQILRQGEIYAVPAGDLTLWTGRAGAIEVRVGGRPVPPLGADAETIRDVSLAAGSLLGRAAAAAPIPSVRAVGTRPL